MDPSLIISITGAIAAIASALVTYYGTVKNRYLAVNEFLTIMESKEFINARKYVYNHDGKFNIDDEQAALVVNYFHHWGILARKNYLPLWVFDKGSGSGLIRLYEKTEDYIISRRISNEDLYYAEYFEWLYYRIKKRAENLEKIQGFKNTLSYNLQK